jgi:hypothetical protein
MPEKRRKSTFDVELEALADSAQPIKGTRIKPD